MRVFDFRRLPPMGGLAVAFVFAFVSTGVPTSAGTIAWANWSSINVGNPDGSAQGTLSPLGEPVVTVNYSGDVESPSQTSASGNFNYWTPTSTWASTTVPDAPTNPGIVSLFGSPDANTLTFSQAIVNPVMALLSLGNPGLQISYTFDANLTILSGGPSNSFGGSSVIQLAPNVVAGSEGNGTIEFVGTFTSLSWTVTGSEFWHGFTLGIEGTAVPEPSSIVLCTIGMVGFGGFMLRKKKSVARRIG
jgi:hypothetical protein